MLDEETKFIDLHYHAGADLYKRRHSVFEAGRRYASRSGWVVVKSHIGSTSAVAWEARQEGLPVSGSVTLNAISGGLSTRVMEQAVYQHGDNGPARLLVYLPTLVGSRHTAKVDRVPFHTLLDPGKLDGLRVSSDSTPLVSEIYEIMRAAADLPVVLATGHASREEILRLVDAALDCGLDRLLLTHPTHPMCGFTVSDLRSLASLPEVYGEITALTRLLGYHDAAEYADILAAHPRLVFTSDLGQLDQPDIDEWIGLRTRWFAAAGLSDEWATKLALRNPKLLLSPD